MLRQCTTKNTVNFFVSFSYIAENDTFGELIDYKRISSLQFRHPICFIALFVLLLRLIESHRFLCEPRKGSLTKKKKIGSRQKHVPNINRLKF